MGRRVADNQPKHGGEVGGLFPPPFFLFFFSFLNVGGAIIMYPILGGLSCFSFAISLTMWCNFSNVRNVGICLCYMYLSALLVQGN